MRSTQENIYVVGDAAGFVEEHFPDDLFGSIQGCIAAISAAKSLGVLDSTTAATCRAELGSPVIRSNNSSVAYHQAWLASLQETGGPDVTVCLCEEVRLRDLLAMAERGPLHPDYIKRMTRAGMGYCQGRRCREQIQLILARATGKDPSQVPLASYRPPFRPLPLSVIQSREETWEEQKMFLRRRPNNSGGRDGD
ncbi:MAG: (2Fe-2S)-binding protein [Candidatus Tectomicrobia bacterium]|nr:(2Fe-2S)-binding protein [Candidatus Tectomicrobia bacterium]